MSMTQTPSCQGHKHLHVKDTNTFMSRTQTPSCQGHKHLHVNDTSIVFTKDKCLIRTERTSTANKGQSTANNINAYITAGLHQAAGHTLDLQVRLKMG